MIGWEVLYDIGIEHRWYEGTRSNPLASVFYADFEDLVYNIAKLNLRNH